jgi:phosphoserine phosphatase RsbU/P
MLPDLVLEEREVWLSPGDVLIAYSDGVTDAINEQEESYGLERLVDMISPLRAHSADEICSAIFADVFKFRGAAAAFDDITALIMRCQGPA